MILFINNDSGILFLYSEQEIPDVVIVTSYKYITVSSQMTRDIILHSMMEVPVSQIVPEQVLLTGIILNSQMIKELILNSQIVQEQVPNVILDDVNQIIVNSDMTKDIILNSLMN